MLKRLSLSPQESGLLAFVLAIKVLLLLYAGLAHAVIENQSAGNLFERGQKDAPAIVTLLCRQLKMPTIGEDSSQRTEK